MKKYTMSEVKEKLLNVIELFKEILNGVKSLMLFLWKNSIYVFYTMVFLICLCFVCGVLNYLTGGVFLKWVNAIFILFFFILIGAFMTLMESKVMAGIQRSKGPNVVGLYGLLQPIVDGLKMIWKETIMPQYSNKFLLVWSPWLVLLCTLITMGVIPYGFKLVFMDLEFSLLFVFMISSLSVYGFLLAGWASNSKYAFLGGMRSAAQMISYEVPLGLVMVIMVCGYSTVNLLSMVSFQTEVWFIWYAPEVFMIFLICIFAESNSAPFDLPEAESELVSGYNVEYSSMGFVCFFLAEYMNLFLLSGLVVDIFLGGGSFFFISFWCSSLFFFLVKVLCLVIFFIWVSASLPSYSYDHLMSLGWKTLLPVSMGLVIFYFWLSLMVLCWSYV